MGLSNFIPLLILVYFEPQVPTDNPCMALKMLQLVTGQSSPGLRLQASF